MPEASELRVAADFLRSRYVGWDIDAIGVTPNGRYKDEPPRGLERLRSFLRTTDPVTLQDVTTRGKFMWWSLWWRNQPLRLHCTFGMSGMWKPVPATDEKHAGLYVIFRDAHGRKQHACFVDPRHFGTIAISFHVRELEAKLKQLGPDPFGEDFTGTNLKALFDSRKIGADVPICEVLMDQRIFCGVGNYVRAEALWESRIDPWRPAASLSDNEWDSLTAAARDVILRSYEAQGATLHTYRTAEGAKGKFEFMVYGRDEDAHGSPVETRRDSNGRTVHWAPGRVI